jgi:DNA-binding transcriptional MerR regulator
MANSSRKKSAVAFRTISEASGELDVPQHVLRFWETKFTQIRPLKRGGRRRYYRPEDLDLLRTIRDLLYVQGYTIKGVQKLFKEGRVDEVIQANGPSVVSGDNLANAGTSSQQAGPGFGVTNFTVIEVTDRVSALAELAAIRQDLRAAFAL